MGILMDMFPPLPRLPTPRRPRSEQRALTAAVLRRLPPGMHQDGEVAGLYVRVLPTGGRSFVLRYMKAGKRHDMHLGSTSELDLASARERARAERLRIKDGADPIAARQAARAEAKRERERAEWTVERAAREVHATLRPGWKNPKHADQWINTLTTYVFPALGSRPVAEVDVAAVVQVLKPIWTTKEETARRVRQRLDAVLSWAVAHGYAAANPVDAAVVLLPKQRDRVEHHDALPVAALPAFMRALRTGTAAPARRALEFLVLTSARSGEVRGATWSEIDLEAATWTVPAARMKAGREHVVPLSEPAVALLATMYAEQGGPAGGTLVFEGPTGAMLSDNALTALLKRMKVDATAHGFRSTFRDWCSENGVSREIAERALAHAVKDATEAAYSRTQLIEQRRPIMSQWAKYCGE